MKKLPGYRPKAGMTTREKGGKTKEEIRGKTNFVIRQPDYEMKDMPVLKRCSIRKAFYEMDYLDSSDLTLDTVFYLSFTFSSIAAMTCPAGPFTMMSARSSHAVSSRFTITSFAPARFATTGICAAG